MAVDVQFRHKGILVEVIELNVTQRALLETPYSWTAWVGGKPMACCGICQDWSWAFLHWDLRRWMLPITRKVKEVLNSYPRAVLADVDEGFPEGVRWAMLLGFRRTQWPGTWIYDAHLS